MGALRKEKRGRRGGREEWDEAGDYLVSINHLYGWVALGSAGIKKLFVGHIRGNKRLRCQCNVT